MRFLTPRVFLAVLTLFAAACSSPRPLPKYQKPIARARFQTVRTTAYTHTEDDHVRYSNRNALGGRLKCGPIHSAAADWSRWPAGTIFRIQETGEVFEVDDYGWALAGTNTIDLYKHSRAAMNAWGVRRVTIENLQWGNPHRSLAILRQRTKHRHIRRMVDEMEGRMAELQRPVETAAPTFASAGPAEPAIYETDRVPVQERRPQPSSRPTVSGQAGVVVSNARPGVAPNPFFGTYSPR
jgi:3D (Asp-Asp-Asp) domain-containing protein